MFRVDIKSFKKKLKNYEKQNFVSRNKNFVQRLTSICLSLFARVNYTYNHTISHHKGIRDDASLNSFITASHYRTQKILLVRTVIFLRTTLYFFWICAKTTESIKLKFEQMLVNALALKFCKKICFQRFSNFLHFYFKMLKSKNRDNFR